MSEIIDHRLVGIKNLENLIKIETTDEPGAGGANHRYQILFQGPAGWEKSCMIQFQKGPLDEVTNIPNGITNEVLLAIVTHRLQSFQKGEFSCRENALAITKLEEAMHWLKHRTYERSLRGVEGTLKK